MDVSAPDGAAVVRANRARGLTARRFVARLADQASERRRRQLRQAVPLFSGQPARVFLGVGIEQVLAVAREFLLLPLSEVECLLEYDEHEIRTGAVCVMRDQARCCPTGAHHHRLLYGLYRRRIDRIDNWDLVDLGAPHVIGGYLVDKPRDVLYELACSANRWERRTAVLAMLRLVRAGAHGDACTLVRLLLDDPEDPVRLPLGGILREVGRRDRGRLVAFLDRYAARMQPSTLSYATELLESEERARYRTTRTYRSDR